MDIDYYYDYDSPDNDDVSEDYIFDEEEDLKRSISDAFKTCVAPSLVQIAVYILTIIGFSFLCFLTWAFIRLRGGGEWLQHFTAVCTGFAALYFTTGHDFLIVFFLSLIVYILILLCEYNKISGIGVIVAIVTIVCQLLYEILWNKPEAWQRIRGVQMVATMKVISLAYDLEEIRMKQKEKPTNKPPTSIVPAVIPYLGYIFCPATCVLGPWMSYSAYLRSLHSSHQVGFRLPLSSIFNALLALVFLCLSNCFVPILCSEHSSWIWLITYKDALSVRCSHYFICYLSQAALSAGGIKRFRTDAEAYDASITKPWLIELPRSLSSLVRIWNAPHHDWLKSYIFRGAYKHFGNYFAAILITYIVSSLLHGYYLKIYLVLLSLGCFAYIEYMLRDKLSSIFDACITSNPCRKPCKFKYCFNKRQQQGNSGAYTVLLVNLCFSCLAIFQLAYLGVLMNSSNLDEENNFSIKETLSRWSSLNYLGHWVALVTFVFYYFI